jgi:hypothetical protein
MEIIYLGLFNVILSLAWSIRRPAEEGFVQHVMRRFEFYSGFWVSLGIAELCLWLVWLCNFSHRPGITH